MAWWWSSSLGGVEEGGETSCGGGDVYVFFHLLFSLCLSAVTSPCCSCARFARKERRVLEGIQRGRESRSEGSASFHTKTTQNVGRARFVSHCWTLCCVRCRPYSKQRSDQNGQLECRCGPKRPNRLRRAAHLLSFVVFILHPSSLILDP